LETETIELSVLETPHRRQYGHAGLANNYDPGYYVAGERLREKQFAGGRTPQVRRLRDGEEFVIQAEAAAARGMKPKTVNGILWKMAQAPDVFGAEAD